MGKLLGTLILSVIVFLVVIVVGAYVIPAMQSLAGVADVL